ncbi:MAG: radical SAM protein [Pseudomonadota bacterium]
MPVGAVQFSKFNLYLADYPEPGDTLVYNAFSGGSVVFDHPTLAALRSIDKSNSSSEAARALADPELLDESVGVLTPSHQAEEKAFRSWYQESRSSSEELVAVVSVTFACNLACTYCCEHTVLNGKAMTNETGQATAAWLASRALEIGARRIRLELTGGEPLLQPWRVVQVAAELRQRLAGTGIELGVGLITNGVLLKPELVDTLLPLGLVHAQVTLDGDETTHPITRRSRIGNENTFPAILRNLRYAASKLNVTVRGNYQPNTLSGFVPLLAKLTDIGVRPGSRVSFRPALSNAGSPIDSGCARNWSEATPKAMIGLADAVWRAGFDPGDLMVLGPCMLQQYHAYSVDPEGSIYLCPGFLGRRDWSIGHVTTGLSPRYDELLAVDVFAECGDCAHRPSCGGGCQANAWLRTGRPAGMVCERGYFETCQAELMTRKYALATAASVEEALAMVPPLALPSSC